MLFEAGAVEKFATEQGVPDEAERKRISNAFVQLDLFTDVPLTGAAERKQIENYLRPKSRKIRCCFKSVRYPLRKTPVC